MSPQTLAAYLHTHIPLAAAMQVEVLTAGLDRVELRAPLAPNINHRGSAFGGSIATLATLAGWSLLRVGLDALDPLPHLVIQRNTMEFLRPLEGAFRASCEFPPALDWNAFLATLAGRGKARAQLAVDVYADDGLLAARFEGMFVALQPQASARSKLSA